VKISEDKHKYECNANTSGCKVTVLHPETSPEISIQRGVYVID